MKFRIIDHNLCVCEYGLVQDEVKIAMKMSSLIKFRVIDHDLCVC
jgi:hypothetical protein